MDGSGGARTAWVYDDWHKNSTDIDTGNKGYPAVDPEIYKQQVRLFHQAGITVGTHAVGDRAIDNVVDTYTAVLQEKPTPDLRHTIIHANLPTPHALETMAALAKTVRCRLSRSLRTLPLVDRRHLLRHLWPGAIAAPRSAADVPHKRHPLVRWLRFLRHAIPGPLRLCGPPWCANRRRVSTAPIRLAPPNPSTSTPRSAPTPSGQRTIFFSTTKSVPSKSASEPTSPSGTVTLIPCSAAELKDMKCEMTIFDGASGLQIFDHPNPVVKAKSSRSSIRRLRTTLFHAYGLQGIFPTAPTGLFSAPPIIHNQTS